MTQTGVNDSKYYERNFHNLPSTLLRKNFTNSDNFTNKTWIEKKNKFEIKIKFEIFWTFRVITTCKL